MKQKVSIIIPIYRAERYIKKCLNTIINQTLKNIEIILIDDCGGDSSIQIAENYAKKDERIKIIYNEKNIGSGDSRNVGIKIAKGEYIAFAAPADWLDLDFYEKLYNRAKKDNLDIVKAKRIKVFEDEDNKKESQNILNKRIKNNLKSNLPLFLSFTYELQSAIYKKSLIDKYDVKYPNIRNGEDDVFLLQATFYSKSFSLIDGTFYYYRIIKTSAIHKIDKVYFTLLITKVKMEMEFLNDKDIDEEHYSIFIKDMFYNLYTKKLLKLNEQKDLASYKNEYLNEIYSLLINYKYVGEEKIKEIIYILTSEKRFLINILKRFFNLLPKRFKNGLIDVVQN